MAKISSGATSSGFTQATPPVMHATPRVTDATPRAPLTPAALTPAARFTPRTPGRAYLPEWEIPQPDHPLPKLDLPRKAKQTNGTSHNFTYISERSSGSKNNHQYNSERSGDSVLRSYSDAINFEKMLLMNFSKIHSRLDELFRSLVQQDKTMELMLKRLDDEQACDLKSLVKDSKPIRQDSKPLFETIEEELKLEMEQKSDKAPSSPVSPGKLQTGISCTSLSPRAKKQSPSNSSPSLAKTNSGRRDRRDVEQLAAIVARHSDRFRTRAWGPRAKATWQFLENRNSGILAFWYGSYLAPMIIVISVCFSFFHTAGDLDMPARTFSMLQMGFEASFALEFMVRFAACPDRREFFCQLFNWIDFCSFAPLFVRIYLLTTDADTYLSVLAVVPMLRMMRILRRFRKFQLLKEAVWLAVEALPVLIYASFLIALMFSGLIYIAEPREHVSSLPEALWFVVVTMTTVGYGDIVPRTAYGNIITVVLMVVSALYIAMPIGIVGHAFSTVWSDRDRLLLIAAIRENFASSGISPDLCYDMFMMFATDEDTFGDSLLALDQFRRLIITLQLNVSDDRTAALFRSLDRDDDGAIRFEEFSELLFPTYGFGASLTKRFEASVDSIGEFRATMSKTLSYVNIEDSMSNIPRRLSKTWSSLSNVTE